MSAQAAWAIIVAAGEGTRLRGTHLNPSQGSVPKPFLPLAGIPMVVRALDAIGACPEIEGAVVVVAPLQVGRAQALLADCPGLRKVRAVVPGGDERQDSVRSGLGRVPERIERVVVHDAARPFAAASLFTRCLEALDEAQAAICAVPVADTLKRVTDDRITRTVDRRGIWRAQTPQAFMRPLLVGAHEAAAAQGIPVTDDAALVERLGVQPALVMGSAMNIKVTTPIDLAMAHALAEVLDAHGELKP